MLAIRPDDYEIDRIPLGSLVVFRRYADEWVGNDEPLEPEHLGHTLPMAVIHIDSLEAVFDPPPVVLEV